MLKIKSKIILIGVILFTVSCQNKGIKNNQTIMDDSKKQVSNMNNDITLESMLHEKRDAFNNTAPEAKKKVYAEGLKSVENSGILDKALNVGDKAPDFSLNNSLHKPVGLYAELKNGSVILTWYRGGWCPYCNITLHYLQEKLPEFQKAGATLIALTPELPDQSLTTSEKHKLEFQVLSDIENKIGKQYGVVFKLTPEVADMYQKAFDLHKYNGDESNELPLAATYVIDQNGIIQYAFLDADYRNRAEPTEILKALAKIKAKK
ncbi:MAG: peroxiredoxin-like family protein [Paludibacter sp.]|nr:peroxiredoxin-like family protein [Paludibacter sp.]